MVEGTSETYINSCGGQGFSKCDSDSLEGTDGKTSYKSESEPERGSGELKDVPLVPVTGGDLLTPFHGV